MCTPQGGRIIFFQSVAVLGYCLFPLDVRDVPCQAAASHLSRSRLRQVASILCLAWKNKVYQAVVLGLGTRAASSRFTD